MFLDKCKQTFLEKYRLIAIIMLITIISIYFIPNLFLKGVYEDIYEGAILTLVNIPTSIQFLTSLSQPVDWTAIIAKWVFEQLAFILALALVLIPIFIKKPKFLSLTLIPLFALFVYYTRRCYGYNRWSPICAPFLGYVLLLLQILFLIFYTFILWYKPLNFKRKPTKSERIAELEKQVAELKNNMDAE